MADRVLQAQRFAPSLPWGEAGAPDGRAGGDGVRRAGGGGGRSGVVPGRPPLRSAGRARQRARVDVQIWTGLAPLDITGAPYRIALPSVIAEGEGFQMSFTEYGSWGQILGPFGFPRSV